MRQARRRERSRRHGLTVRVLGSLLLAPVALLLAAYGGVAQIMPPVVAALYWRGATRFGALAGLFVGLVTNCIFLVVPGPISGLHEGAYGLCANVLVLVVGSLLTSKDPEELVRAYVEESADVPRNLEAQAQS